MFYNYCQESTTHSFWENARIFGASLSLSAHREVACARKLVLPGGTLNLSWVLLSFIKNEILL